MGAGEVERLHKDIVAGLSKSNVVNRSIARLPLYERLNTVKIDTSKMDVDRIAAEIADLGR